MSFERCLLFRLLRDRAGQPRCGRILQHKRKGFSSHEMEALEQYEKELRQRNDELEARAAAALSQALAVKVPGANA